MTDSVNGVELAALLGITTTTKPGLWVGQRPSLNFDSLRAETRHFSAESLPTVYEFFRLAENASTAIARAPAAQKAEEGFNHFLRTSAIFVLQAIHPAKGAVLAEGGCVPEPRVLEVVYFPDLPKLPARGHSRMSWRQVTSYPRSLLEPDPHLF